ncbi:hypothetical protein ACGFMK_04835 [Amycolatopsis sp. NPDC049252]|uniref:hypothetical protein n=1 Tax=Amycolatopsis sp. NPDC049252 TaxID=3363933 RepID=UPI0037104D00
MDGTADSGALGSGTVELLGASDVDGATEVDAGSGSSAPAGAANTPVNADAVASTAT